MENEVLGIDKIIRIKYVNFDGDVPKSESFNDFETLNRFIVWKKKKKSGFIVLKLYCERNGLTSLPELPEGLKKLVCFGNKLTSLPELPKSLENLNCWSNNLKSLPELPKSLKKLECEANNLTSLPKLPNSLEKLDCSHNNLTRLPDNLIELRNLEIINYDDNEIELTIREINFLNRIEMKKLVGNFYDDSQNVHNSHIQKQLLNNINTLMSDI